MNGKLTLGLLLLMAGGLIYAGSHHQDAWNTRQARHEPGRRLSHVDGHRLRRHAAGQSARPSDAVPLQDDAADEAHSSQRAARVAGLWRDSGGMGGWGLCGSD